MRLLSIGPDHVGLGDARQRPTSNRLGHRQRNARQHLSLWDLCQYLRSDQASRAIQRTGRLITILDRIASQPAKSVQPSVSVVVKPASAHG
jgi:hypothetical protein